MKCIYVGLDIYTREGGIRDRVKISLETLPSGYTNERLFLRISCK
jgi:hypothetical protein